MTKWRVAACFTGVSVILQLAVIQMVKHKVAAHLGEGYLYRWPHLWKIGSCIAFAVLLGWYLIRKEPLIPYIWNKVQAYGNGCIFVRMSEQEAWALNTHAVTYKAKKISPKKVKYFGLERRKQA